MKSGLKDQNRLWEVLSMSDANSQMILLAFYESISLFTLAAPTGRDPVQLDLYCSATRDIHGLSQLNTTAVLFLLARTLVMNIAAKTVTAFFTLPQVNFVATSCLIHAPLGQRHHSSFRH